MDGEFMRETRRRKLVEDFRLQAQVRAPIVGLMGIVMEGLVELVWGHKCSSMECGREGSEEAVITTDD
jgi:hypothetical protein